MIYNPAIGIKPPRTSTHPAETITYLEQDEANRLLQGIDHRNELKLVRDRLLLGLMTIEGTRTLCWFLVKEPLQDSECIKSRFEIGFCPIGQKSVKLLIFYLI